VKIGDMQFGFRLGRGTTDAIICSQTSAGEVSRKTEIPVVGLCGSGDGASSCSKRGFMVGPETAGCGKVDCDGYFSEWNLGNKHRN